MKRMIVPRTMLTEKVSKTDPVLAVIDTTGKHTGVPFPDFGVLFVGAECIFYSSKDSTHFFGCERAYDHTSFRSHVARVEVTGKPIKFVTPQNLQNLQGK